METEIFTCKYFKFGRNTTGLSQSHLRNFLACSIIFSYGFNCDSLSSHLSSVFLISFEVVHFASLHSFYSFLDPPAVISFMYHFERYASLCESLCLRSTIFISLLAWISLGNLSV